MGEWSMAPGFSGLHEPARRVPLLHLTPSWGACELTDVDDVTRPCVFDFERNFYGRHTRFTTHVLGVGLHFGGRLGRRAGRLAKDGAFALFCL